MKVMFSSVRGKKKQSKKKNRIIRSMDMSGLKSGLCFMKICG